MVEPYEQTLKAMPVDDRQAWSHRVAQQLTEAMPDLAQVVFLASKPYREFLAQSLADRGVALDVPMQGLRIGEQKRWLKRAIQAG